MLYMLASITAYNSAWWILPGSPWRYNIRYISQFCQTLDEGLGHPTLPSYHHQGETRWVLQEGRRQRWFYFQDQNNLLSRMFLLVQFKLYKERKMVGWKCQVWETPSGQGTQLLAGWQVYYWHCCQFLRAVKNVVNTPSSQSDVQSGLERVFAFIKKGVEFGNNYEPCT